MIDKEDEILAEVAEAKLFLGGLDEDEFVWPNDDEIHAYFKQKEQKDMLKKCINPLYKTKAPKWRVSRRLSTLAIEEWKIINGWHRLREDMKKWRT